MLRSFAGDSLVNHAIARLAAVPEVTSIVVALPPDHFEGVRVDLPDAVAGVPVVAVAGGALRQDSVRAMLAAVPAGATHVLCHDAARAFTPSATIGAVVAALAAGERAVIPVLPVVDTIARVVDDEVVGNVARDELRIVQTPQGFDLEVLRRAHAEAPADLEATDDASLVSRLGIPVRAVPGHTLARKVTTPEDLLIIGALLEADGAPAQAIGARGTAAPSDPAETSYAAGPSGHVRQEAT